MIYVYIILGVAVLVITVLALIGMKVKRQEKKIREQLGLDDTTNPEEVKKAIERFKKKNFMTNKAVRDEFLKSKGYTVLVKLAKRPKRPKQLTGFQMAMYRFRKLKLEDKIEIYPALRNKFSIPYYEIRKTVSEQIRGIE